MAKRKTILRTMIMETMDFLLVSRRVGGLSMRIRFINEDRADFKILARQYKFYPFIISLNFQLLEIKSSISTTNHLNKKIRIFTYFLYHILNHKKLQYPSSIRFQPQIFSHDHPSPQPHSPYFLLHPLLSSISSFTHSNYIEQMKCFCLKLKKMYHSSALSEIQPLEERQVSYFSAVNSSKRPCSAIKRTQVSSREQISDFKAFKTKYGVKLEKFPLIGMVKLSFPSSFVTTADLNRLDFSPLSYQVKDLILYAKVIIEADHDRKILSRSFNLHKLIQLIARNYNVNPYHNFTHAFSVLLLLFQSYNRSQQLQKSLTQKQWFFVFIAALVHDLNHPGNTNAFQMKKKSKVAVEHGFQSVLEKMHLSTFWKLLKHNQDVNFLQGHCTTEANQIKKLISRMVLATDAGRHSAGLTGLKSVSSQLRHKKGDHSIFLVQQLFHACDIGNPCLNFDQYLNWSVLVSFQFNQESQKQKKLGLAVTPHLAFEGVDKFYQNQLSFCGAMVLPIWKEMGNVFPQLGEMVQNVLDNMEELNRRIDEGKV